MFIVFYPMSNVSLLFSVAALLFSNHNFMHEFATHTHGCGAE